MPTNLRLFSSLVKKPAFAKAWLLPAWVMLGMSRLVILTVTFRRLSPYLGHSVGLKAYTILLTPLQEKRALQISYVIRLAARYSPWVANCFTQAVTARVLLGFFNIPYALYFGISRDNDEGEVKAHAWVAAGKVSVTGGYSFSQYTIVGTYLSRTCYLEGFH